VLKCLYFVCVAPVEVKYPEQGELSENVIWDDGNVIFECIASGSNINSIVWFKDKTGVSDNDFTISPLTDVVDDSFPHGQKNGKKVVITWRHTPSCEYKDDLDGTYHCEVSGTAASTPTTHTSGNLKVELQCEY
jgi:hypothetical protein